MKRLLFLQLVISSCFFPAAVSAEVYRWINDRGEVVFGDQPPEEVKAGVVPLGEAARKGMKFATPEQIEKLHEKAQNRKQSNSRRKKTNPQDAYCRRYRSDLNKVEIYLQHTNSDRDVQKARDLRKLIKRECGKLNVSINKNSSRCTSYHHELLKTEIYIEHTPNPRDKQKVIDLRKQIVRECN